MFKKIAVILLICFSFFCVRAQDKDVLAIYEDSLSILMYGVANAKTDNEKLNYNEKLCTLLEEALVQPKSYTYPFDSLKYMVRLVSPDNSFRIFTWYIRLRTGECEHFGFIQVFNEEKRKYSVIPLIDKTKDLQNLESTVYDNEHWFGALYYKIIVNKDGTKNSYTLLGWNGSDKYISRKIIEPIVFDEHRPKAYFGGNVFLKMRKNKRFILQYNPNAVTTLQYEEQAYPMNKQNLSPADRSKSKNSKTKSQNEVKMKKDKLIVFDYLVPEVPIFEGMYQHYVPSGQIDGFIYENGRWRLIQNIDARNPKKNKYHDEYVPLPPKNKQLYTPKDHKKAADSTAH